MKKANRAYVKTSREMILDLLAKPMTIRQLSRLCQRDYSTVRRALIKLRSDRLVHITDWEVHDVGSHESVWSLGDEDDAKNPKSLSPSVRCRRYRMRRKPPVLKNRDPLLAALMGGCRDSTMAE